MDFPTFLIYPRPPRQGGRGRDLREDSMKNDRFNTVMSALARAASYEPYHVAGPEVTPFVTIKRQAGAGGHTIQERLVRRLNDVDPGDPPWSGFDRELVEMVTEQSNLYRPLVESLGDETRSWLEETFRQFFRPDGSDSEFKVYWKMAQTIRALAQAGRVVIVGRGGVFITRGMLGGTHVHLVAPLEDRIRHMAERLELAPEDGEEHVRRLDRNREAFYRRYWYGASLAPETFTVTFNTAVTTDEQIVAAILPMVQGIQGRPVYAEPVGVGR
jgi:cytidylate kinase